MSINKVILLGRVGRNPEIKDVNGAKVAQFSLATGEKYKDRNGNLQEKTEWHNIVAWRNTADFCEKYIHTGNQIFVEGKIAYRSWDTDKGEKRYSTDIVADKVEPTGSKGKSQDDDLPL